MKANAIRVTAVVVLAGACRGDREAPRESGGGAEAQSMQIAAGASFAVSVDVPGRSEALAARHRDRLVAAQRRKDPAAVVEVTGRTREHDDFTSSLCVVASDHDRGHADGFTLREIGQGLRQEAADAASARGIEWTLDVHEGSRHIDLVVSLHGADGVRSRFRMFVVGGRLYERGCQCTGELCVALATCTLPAPPADALTPDQLVR